MCDRSRNKSIYTLGFPTFPSPCSNLGVPESFLALFALQPFSSLTFRNLYPIKFYSGHILLLQHTALNFPFFYDKLLPFLSLPPVSSKYLSSSFVFFSELPQRKDFFLRSEILPFRALIMLKISGKRFLVIFLSTCFLRG